MKALIFGLHLALLAPLCAWAQKSPVTFGDIPMDDMTMKVYEKDSSASAVVLVDYGEAHVSRKKESTHPQEAQYVLQYETHVRIKILKKEGFRWSKVQIHLYRDGVDEEHVTRLKAATYNLEDGKIIRTNLSKDAVAKIKVDRYHSLHEFTLPDVREGSVLEYSYATDSDFYTVFPNWVFQDDIPVRWSEYWAQVPTIWTYEKYIRGYITPTYEVKAINDSKFQVDAHHWVAQDVPAFKEEPYMNGRNNFIAAVSLTRSHTTGHGQPTREIMGSWQRLNAHLLAHEEFGKVVTGSAFLKKKTEELTAGIDDPLQKVKAIFGYVQHTLAWNGINHPYATDLRQVFEEKKGTASEINFTLAAMLEKAAIPVDLVLLSTRDHGFVRKEYPMASQFNYVICVVTVGDKNFPLDATERYLPMGILPERCLNGDGLVISNTRHGWIPIQPKAKARRVIDTELALNTTGGLKGKMKYILEGYAARDFREAYFTQGEQEYVKAFLADKTWGVQSATFQNQADVSQPVEQLYSLDISTHATVRDERMYINPFIMGLVKENIFKSEARQYPVDLARPEEDTYICRLEIPDGYVVESLPKPQVLIMPDNGARYTYNVTQTGKQLSIVSILQINKSMFVTDEYPHLRGFYDALVAKQTEEIVLKKQ